MADEVFDKEEAALYQALGECCQGKDVGLVISAAVRLVISCYNHFQTREQVHYLRASLARFLAHIDSTPAGAEAVAIAEALAEKPDPHLLH